MPAGWAESSRRRISRRGSAPRAAKRRAERATRSGSVLFTAVAYISIIAELWNQCQIIFLLCLPRFLEERSASSPHPIEVAVHSGSGKRRIFRFAASVAHGILAFPGQI